MAKRTRGSGHLFHPPGSKNWSIQFYVGGLRYRESTRTSKRREWKLIKGMDGGPTRTRTWDQRIMSPLL